jgi:FMN phosphatase YigB (HAD superfamily)
VIERRPDHLEAFRLLRPGFDLEAERRARAAADADIVASSAGLGAAKPTQAFFTAIAQLAELDPAHIAYVGDRVDNDVLPAREAGMVAIHLRRGPWGHLHAAWPEARRAHLRIESLGGLPDALAAL